MEISAYRVRPDEDWPLRPAPLQRAWMDAFPQRWPYRCLPMVIANQAGWEVGCPVGLEVVWGGQDDPASLHVEFERDAEKWAPYIGSHFGSGVLTFALPYLFRTARPIGTWVRGPSNAWVEGACPLEGWVETWASEVPFTMNWKIVAAGTPVRFRSGEAICLVQPWDPGPLEAARPTLRDLSSDPVLEGAFTRFQAARLEFERVRSVADSQHAYTRGEDGAGQALPGHRTRLRVPPFVGPAGEEG